MLNGFRTSIVAYIVTKSKILVPNTTIEVSGDQTFLDLFTNLKREALNPTKKTYGVTNMTKWKQLSLKKTINYLEMRLTPLLRPKMSQIMKLLLSFSYDDNHYQ